MQRFEPLESRRFLAGDLVADFGDRGRLTLATGSVAVDIVQQSSGKLVVLSVNLAKTQSTLQRLNANGSVDPSFTPRTFAASTLQTQLKQASDGTLLVLSDGTLRKLTSSGAVDTGFRTISGLGGFDMTSDGGLYGFTQSGTQLTALSDATPTFSNTVRRFRSNGVELSRKTLSVPTIPASSSDPNAVFVQSIYELAVTADGRFTAAVVQHERSEDNSGGVVRWTADGVLDTSFSQDGVSSVVLNREATFADFEVLPSGRMVLAFNSDDSEGFVYDFEANGSVDTNERNAYVFLGGFQNSGVLDRIVVRGNDSFVAVGSYAPSQSTNLDDGLWMVASRTLMSGYEFNANNIEDAKLSFFGFQPTAAAQLQYGYANAGVFTSDGNFVAVGGTSNGIVTGQQYFSSSPEDWQSSTVSLTKFAFATPAAQRVGAIAWVENNVLNVETGATRDLVEVATVNGSNTANVRLSVQHTDSITFTGPINKIVINTFAGNDTIRGSSFADQIFAGTGDDSILGGDGNDTVEGSAGRDTLIGDAGNDVLLGGAGQDFAEGRAGNDSIYGGNDQDNLFGGSGNDLIEGNASNDFLVGEAGNDALIGGSGNDTMNGGSGTDFLDGNDGTDTELYRSSIDTRYNMEIFA